MMTLILTMVLAMQNPIEQPDATQTIEIESAVLQVIDKIEVPATASGPIKKLMVKQGDVVKTGQLLAIVENTNATIALAEAKLELEIAKSKAASNLDVEFARKSLDVSKSDFVRANESNQRYDGVVSDREMDRLRLLVEKSYAELAKIKFDKSVLELQQKLKQTAVAKSEFELQQHQVQAASGGQVVEIEKREGEWVNVSESVVHLARLDTLRVEEYLAASEANSLLRDAKATFSILVSGNARKLAEGRVVFVSPEINPLNSTVLVWIEFDNHELNLRPGMKGQVSIRPASNVNRAAASN